MILIFCDLQNYAMYVVFTNGSNDIKSLKGFNLKINKLTHSNQKTF